VLPTPEGNRRGTAYRLSSIPETLYQFKINEDNDPGYAQSMPRNFMQSSAARTIETHDRSASTMDQIAQKILEETS
jgi:hypothetical protein